MKANFNTDDDTSSSSHTKETVFHKLITFVVKNLTVSFCKTKDNLNTLDNISKQNPKDILRNSPLFINSFILSKSYLSRFSYIFLYRLYGSYYKGGFNNSMNTY